MKTKDSIGRGAALVLGIAYGAGMMYLLDPDLGHRRRVFIRDKAVRLRNRARWWVERQLRDVIHNVSGSFAEIRAKTSEGTIADDRLVRRVRAQIGHVVSHPASLEVIVRSGHVVVRGPILAGERDRLEQRLSETRGVRDWALEVREPEGAARSSEFQGESRFQRKEWAG